MQNEIPNIRMIKCDEISVPTIPIEENTVWQVRKTADATLKT
jgi:hypothetical protein